MVYRNIEKRRRKDKELWATATPEFKRNKAITRYKNKLLKYCGFTFNALENLRKKQNNKCAICNEKTKLCVDHDHETNKVRGLLCYRCNKGLGHFKDDMEKLKQAFNYLKKSSEEKDELRTVVSYDLEEQLREPAS